MKDEETFSNLFKYSAGFQSEAYKQKIYIERVNGLSIDYFELDINKLGEEIPNDGDRILAKIPNKNIENKITVSGNVVLPGTYSLKSVKTIKNLINESGGLTNEALKTKALLFRNNNGIQNELISINLNNSSDLNTELKLLDSLFIPSMKDLEKPRSIKVFGLVKNPDTYPFKDNMTISDAIIIAGGFDSESSNTATIYRNVSADDDELLAEIYSVKTDKNFIEQDDFMLLENDIISIDQIEYLKSLDTYSIIGEVALPGNFAINKANLSLKDVLDKQKFKKTADINSIYIERDSIKVPANYKNFITDIEVINGDKIYIPRLDNTITVSGSVYNESILPYNKNETVRNAIKKSGGLKPNTLKKGIYILSRDGLGRKPRKFFGINIYPKLKPGDKIIIPEKEENEKISFGDIIGIASSLGSLLAIVKIATQ